MNGANKTFAIFGNKFQTEKSAYILQVFRGIASIGCHIVIEQEFAAFLRKNIDFGQWSMVNGQWSIINDGIVFEQANHADIQADFAVSIGGDGTFLNTARLIGDRGIPIIGINTGHLGFISDILPQEVEAFLHSVANGDYRIEERTLLQVDTDGGSDESMFALNEVAILKHDNSSMISIRASVDGNYLATYLADGLIISTPTGSTGYSLSVGGPIVSPDSKSIVLSPIAAHSLAVRPMVLNDNVKVELHVQSRSHNFMLAVDGRSESLYEGTVVNIQSAPHKLRIVRSNSHSFFDTLRNKLLWGVDKR